MLRAPLACPRAILFLSRSLPPSIHLPSLSRAPTGRGPYLANLTLSHFPHDPSLSLSLSSAPGVSLRPGPLGRRPPSTAHSHLECDGSPSQPGFFSGNRLARLTILMVRNHIFFNKRNQIC